MKLSITKMFHERIDGANKSLPLFGYYHSNVKRTII